MARDPEIAKRIAQQDFEDSRWYPTYLGLKWGAIGALSLGAFALLLGAGFGIANGWSWDTFLAKLDPFIVWMILGAVVVNFVVFIVPWQIARLLRPYQRGWGLIAFRGLQIAYFGGFAALIISTQWPKCGYNAYCWFFK